MGMVKDGMEKKDQDKDGKICREEFRDADKVSSSKALSDVHFQNLDTNGDGALDLDELVTWETGHYFLEQTMRDLFKEADADEDGKLEADELVNARQKIIDSHYNIVSWHDALEV